MLRIMTTKGYRYLSLLKVTTLAQPVAGTLNDWEFVVCYAPMLGSGPYLRVDRLLATGGEMMTVRGPMRADMLKLSVEWQETPAGLAIIYRFATTDGNVVAQSVVNEVDGGKVITMKGHS